MADIVITTAEAVDYDRERIINVQQMMKLCATRIGRYPSIFRHGPKHRYYYVLDGKVWSVDMDGTDDVSLRVIRWDYFEFCAQLRLDAEDPEGRVLPRFVPNANFHLEPNFKIGDETPDAFSPPPVGRRLTY